MALTAVWTAACTSVVEGEPVGEDHELLAAWRAGDADAGEALFEGRDILTDPNSDATAWFEPAISRATRSPPTSGSSAATLPCWSSSRSWAWPLSAPTGTVTLRLCQ